MDRCKCCLEENDLESLWKENYDNEVYGVMLTECFALPWHQPIEETAVEYICKSCIVKLKDAVNFKTVIQQSEQLLMEIVTDELKHQIKEEKDDSETEADRDCLDMKYEYEDETKDPLPDLDQKIKMKSEKRSKKAASVTNKKMFNYTEEELNRCIEEVQNKTMSRVKASFMFNVPVKVIKKELSKRRIEKEKKSRTKVKGQELEKQIHNIGIILNNTNATPIRSRNDIGYGCCFCDVAFPDPADLKNHTLAFHDADTRNKFAKGKRLWEFLVKLDITDLQCEICKEKLLSVENMMDHLQSHDFVIHRDINNHILPFKFDEEELRCVICQVAFNKYKGLLEHMSRHYRNYVCEVCDQGFVTKAILVLHKEGHKTGAFACAFCSKVCDTLRKKKSHERAVHIHSQLISKCGYCGEKFSTYRKKQKHMNSVHGVNIKEVKCQACERCFKTQSALRIHTKRDHLMERRFSCKFCDMRFFASRELTSHLVKHTGNRDFQCDVCLKAFGTKKTLREHLRIHANDRRYKCMHCSQAFIQNCSLKGHLRSKHGIS